MKVKLCLIAGIFGIALITGLFESLSSPRHNEGQGNAASGSREEDVNETAADA